MKLLRGRGIDVLSSLVLCCSTLAVPGGISASAQDVNQPWPADPYLANNRQPDERYKADVLVVVAHPDDEIMAAAYIARLIDQKKRVALVWTTRGDGGTNAVGPEQATAMGDIREVEGMHAAASLGVEYMWNLGGPDTPSQNPLESLETCNHSRCLDRLVRLVRLTRPTVILTWLPLGVTGENHGDHQASGVMATEAFDLAGDPTAFSEQVSPAREPKQNSNRLEGLRPWQPQKIYYFSNPTHTEFFDGQGPSYPTADISPIRHISYGQIAAQEFILHRTQGGGKLEQALRDKGAEALKKGPIPLSTPSQFILGKSLVPSGVTDDVFAGVVPAGIPFHLAPGYKPAELSAPSMEIGGSWHFYREWWQAHGIDHLAKLIPDEVTVEVGGTLRLPLIVNNPLSQPIHVSFRVQAPTGWTVTPLTDTTIDAHTVYFLRVQAAAPATKVPGWQAFEVTAQTDGKPLGSVPLRVELASWALPQ
jgi:LmbE family N-acetylglucosaminyl deacetylase